MTKKDPDRKHGRNPPGFGRTPRKQVCGIEPILPAEDKELILEIPESCQVENVFFLPEGSRWTCIIENAEQGDIALNVDFTLKSIQRNNKKMSRKTWFSIKTQVKNIINSL